MIVIRGVVHHLLGPLAPPQGSPHQFAQLYIIDNADAQAAARFAALGQGNVDLDRRTLQELQQMLLGNNVYVQRFVQAMDLPSQDLANYEIVIRVDGSIDCRRCNAPTSNEVANLMPGEWMGWMHGYFLVSHFVLFLMVLAVLVVTFLDNTFLAVLDLSSLLCLLTNDGDPDGDPEGSNP
jgi:hypothetical protein